MAGDRGFEPRNGGIKIRCLGPDLANPQLNGVEGEIRTHGGRDLQSLALGHSATSTCLAPEEGIEPPLRALETLALPLYYSGMVACTGYDPVSIDYRSIALPLS